MARANFPDEVCAACCEAARFTCEYCGGSTWLPVHGMSASALVGWTDHLQPACVGGSGTRENAVHACYRCNRARGIGEPWARLFSGPGQLARDWRPVNQHLVTLKSLGLSPTKARVAARGHVRLHAGAHSSDWYLNRAVQGVLSGAFWDAAEVRPDGKPYSRDDWYYAKAALAAVRRWRSRSSGIASLEARGMVHGDEPKDSRLFLSIRTMDSAEEILACIRRLRAFRRA